jgi:thiaminase/transcriptional activator TenA
MPKKRQEMTMIVPSAESLKQKYIKQWEAILNHKFIIEMGNDSLPLDKFVFYLKQDHIFLKEFCCFLLNAKQKAAASKEKGGGDHPKLAEWFDGLYHSIIDTEMQMQKELLSSLAAAAARDMSVVRSNSTASSNAATAAAATTATATTSSYISFLRKISSPTGGSSSSSLEAMVSAMAPCPWSYLEIAQKLSKNIDEDNNGSIKTEVYRKWIRFYASEESQKQVEELKDILGRLYCNASKPLKLSMQKHFEEACNHEYSFWEMAYNLA